MTIMDRTVSLEVNGSTQQVRLCADGAGLPPMLIVQAGPGLPVRHEVRRFQQLLRLESSFLVAYWDQRGCGNASQNEAKSVSLRQQVDDLRTVLRWLHNETGQTVTVLGISLGATFVLQAVGDEGDSVRSVIAVSPDADTTRSDAAVEMFLREKGVLAANHRVRAKLEKLGAPPYTDAAAFQLRASLLADLGGIEVGRNYGALLRGTLFGMLGTYGVVGTAKALRNMNLIQSALLPQLVTLDLLADPPRVKVPAHYIFGERDPLTPAAIATQLPRAIAAPATTVALVPNAGHMVHFDQPAVVRAIAMRAGNDA